MASCVQTQMATRGMVWPRDEAGERQCCGETDARALRVCGGGVVLRGFGGARWAWFYEEVGVVLLRISFLLSLQGNIALLTAHR
jgi:hypothetical protein